MIWTEPALEDLYKIIDYIALDKPHAAKKYAHQVFESVNRLSMFPYSGKKIDELPETHYLEIIVKPSRIFYKNQGSDVIILHVCRGEHLLDPDLVSYS